MTILLRADEQGEHSQPGAAAASRFSRLRATRRMRTAAKLLASNQLAAAARGGIMSP
jgi:hypothetical protein